MTDTTIPYTWTQTLTEVTVTINSSTPIKSRDLLITINTDSLFVKNKTTNETIIDGKLSKSIKKADSMWSIEDGKTIVLELSKVNKTEWWSCVIQGHPEIDVTQIKPENSQLSDLDGETRSMVEKMMYDQRQKAAGLPTSDEQKKKEMFEKFKNQNPNLDFTDANINL
ncbi:hypothetical protein CYY_002066 [Polysphondylium violaceum]|uniref:CS domain-containing protein n=1 Tax=Polysphondylium violaceum TaxID=133409 RepID=A0A8J4V799_9MYCE|nr:hypothetical protein CYY_002066 [Polysphondylium violaceum]